jgi:hypothetical protein
MLRIFYKDVRARFLAVAVVAFTALSVLGCGKECDKCQSDADCTAEGLVCVKFSNGDQRCGSGLGATTCRIP